MIIAEPSTIEEYIHAIIYAEEQIRNQSKIIQNLKRDLFNNLCPIKRNWIVEKGKTRIRVMNADYWEQDGPNYAGWTLWGPVLTNKNVASKNHTGFHSVTIVVHSNGSIPEKVGLKIISKGDGVPESLVGKTVVGQVHDHTTRLVETGDGVTNTFSIGGWNEL